MGTIESTIKPRIIPYPAKCAFCRVNINKLGNGETFIYVNNDFPELKGSIYTCVPCGRLKKNIANLNQKFLENAVEKKFGNAENILDLVKIEYEKVKVRKEVLEKAMENKIDNTELLLHLIEFESDRIKHFINNA